MLHFCCRYGNLLDAGLLTYFSDAMTITHVAFRHQTTGKQLDILLKNTTLSPDLFIGNFL